MMRSTMCYTLLLGTILVSLSGAGVVGADMEARSPPLVRDLIRKLCKAASGWDDDNSSRFGQHAGINKSELIRLGEWLLHVASLQAVDVDKPALSNVDPNEEGECDTKTGACDRNGGVLDRAKLTSLKPVFGPCMVQVDWGEGDAEGNVLGDGSDTGFWVCRGMNCSLALNELCWAGVDGSQGEDGMYSLGFLNGRALQACYDTQACVFEAKGVTAGAYEFRGQIVSEVPPQPSSLNRNPHFDSVGGTPKPTFAPIEFRLNAQRSTLNAQP
eukprot:913142-Rhodomonas_salina.1